MPHFSMLVQTEANAGLDDGNMVHARVIEIIFCIFLTYPIIYQLGTVYYCTNHPSNTISSLTLKCYVGFQKVTSEPLEHSDFVYHQGHTCIPPYKNRQNLDYLQIEIIKVNPLRNKVIVFTTVCGPSKKKNCTTYLSALYYCLNY